jgi:hypothetical protein
MWVGMPSIFIPGIARKAAGAVATPRLWQRQYRCGFFAQTETTSVLSIPIRTHKVTSIVLLTCAMISPSTSAPEIEIERGDVENDQHRYDKNKDWCQSCDCPDHIDEGGLADAQKDEGMNDPETYEGTNNGLPGNAFSAEGRSKIVEGTGHQNRM